MSKFPYTVIKSIEDVLEAEVGSVDEVTNLANIGGTPQTGVDLATLLQVSDVNLQTDGTLVIDSSVFDVNLSDLFQPADFTEVRDITNISGTSLTGADWTPLLQHLDVDLSNLLQTSDQPLDVSSAEVDVDINSQTLAQLVALLELDDGGGSYGEIYRRNNAIRASIENDEVGIGSSNKQQITASTTLTSTWISLNLGDVRNGIDIAVDTSGAATLTIQVSTTGDFAGEEFQIRTIDYSSAVVELEQFEFRHQYVRCQVDSNLNDLEMVARGD